MLPQFTLYQISSCGMWKLRIARYEPHGILCTVLKTNMYLSAYPCALHCVSCDGTKVKCACVYCRKYASTRGLTENWRTYRLFSGIRRNYYSLVCLHEFITLYYCRLQYFHCNFVYIIFRVPIHQVESRENIWRTPGLSKRGMHDFYFQTCLCNKTLVTVCLMNLVVPVFTSPSDIKQRNSTMSYRSISYLTIQMVSFYSKVMFHWHCSEVFTLSMIVIRVAMVKRRGRVCLLDVVVTWFALCFVRFRFDRKYA